jgi:cytoskeletal protein CcmA (bactofilin family)
MDPKQPNQNQPNANQPFAQNQMRPPAAGFSPEIPRKNVEIPAAPPVGNRGITPNTPHHHQQKQDNNPFSDNRPAHNSQEKVLHVGKDIQLSGEISCCDRLIVEGKVEVNLADAKMIEVKSSGTYKGNAEVERAIIDGEFHGVLTVKEVIIKPHGRINGTLKYTQMVMEAGGKIQGQAEYVATE